MLRTTLQTALGSWVHLLPKLEIACKSMNHNSIGAEPFVAELEYLPRAPMHLTASLPLADLGTIHAPVRDHLLVSRGSKQYQAVQTRAAEE